MTQDNHDKVIAISQELSSYLQSGLILKASKGEEIKQLEKLSLEVGSKGYFCKIAFAGQVSNGIYNVQFNADNGSGHSSTWPAWAFELAKLALLHGKKIFYYCKRRSLWLQLIAVLTRMRYRSIAQVYEFQGFSQSRCTSCVQEPL